MNQIGFGEQQKQNKNKTKKQQQPSMQSTRASKETKQF
jgi:ribosomal protein L28